MLSVIVPIYNVEQYLPKCIESIINQSYRELEILLIDDGSTDSCPSICDGYARKDHRIRVFHKKNEGLVRARKTGLDWATGDYIAFVDGDDWIEADMYLKLVRVMEDSGADFLDSSYFCDREGDFYIEKRIQGIYEINSYARHRFFKTLLLADHFIQISPSIWSKVYKADIIKASYRKVPDSMQYGEDVISLIYCFLAARKLLYVEEAFYHYNYREDSMSHLKSASYMRKELVLWNYCGNIMMEHDGQIKQEEIDRFFFHKVYMALGYLNPYEFPVAQYYAFPCMEMLLDKRIVIYGAGRVGKDYVSQIARYERCEIVCWVDRNYEMLHPGYRKVRSVEAILKKAYDIVLLAVSQKQAADGMEAFLLGYGVPQEKIIWFAPDTII